MLKITGWSLLLGVAALIAGLMLFYAPAASDPRAAPVMWGPAAGEVPVSNAGDVGAGTQVKLNALGVGIVTLKVESASAPQYPFLHIALENAPHNLKVSLAWASTHGSEQPQLYPLENRSLASQWIATNELKGWSGEISVLTLIVIGQAGETVLIRDFSLHPTSRRRQLQAIYSDITAHEPWERASMNTYTGVTSVSSFYPVALSFALLFMSLLAYGALVVLSRGKLRFRLANVALIFLANWIILDVVWQKRLWHQLADTYRTFAHVEPLQRISVGPDAAFYSFASQVNQHLSTDSRVIVASSDHYNGMRVAYFLYPFNVYWSVHDPQVPYDEFLREGDYIALIRPSTFRFDGRQGVLSAPDRVDRPVKLVFSDSTGTLVKLL